MLWAQTIPSASTAASATLSGLGLLGTLLLWLTRYSRATETRVDAITASQIASIVDERNRAIADRDHARADCERAEQEADTWQAKATDLAVALSRAQTLNETYQHALAMLPPGMASSDDADPSPSPSPTSAPPSSPGP